MGIGDWGLGIGDWGLGPIPNPQSPFFLSCFNNNNTILNKFNKNIIKIIYIKFNKYIY